MSGEKIIPTKQYEQYEQYVQGHNPQKKRFQFSNFLWPKLPIFSKKSHFLPLNGRKDCQYFAQSCPWGWQRLTPKRSVGAIKLSDAVLKVWGNLPTLQGWLDSWGCLFPDRLKKQHIKINDQSAASCAVIENQQAMTKNHQKIIRNHQKLSKITQNHQKFHQILPAIPTSQPTCTSTTNSTPQIIKNTKKK